MAKKAVSAPANTSDFFIGGVRLSRLIQEFETPFYVYDLDRIRERARSMRQAAPRASDIFYALKANSNSHVLRVLREEGLGLDVVSGGEIERGLKFGFLPSQMIFSGVGKTEKEIFRALELQIAQINVESLEELARIARISRESGFKARVALRVNPDVRASTHPYISTGLKENKFGISLKHLKASQLAEIIGAGFKTKKSGSGSGRTGRLGGVTLQGLALHIGSQLLDLAPILEAAEKSIGVLKSLRSAGYPITGLDVGGGLGIPYRDREIGPDFSDLVGPLEERFLKGGIVERLQFEPGRYVVGSFGWLVTRVEYVKRGPHKNFVIVDTGMHQLLRPALYGSFHRVLHFRSNGLLKGEATKAPALIEADVVGPICESSDFLAKNRMFKGIREGDYLLIRDVGAYGAVMASQYNLRPPAWEVAVSGNFILPPD